MSFLKLILELLGKLETPLMDSKNLHTTFFIQNSLQKIHLADSTPRYSLSFTGAAPTAVVKS